MFLFTYRWKKTCLEKPGKRSILSWKSLIKRLYERWILYFCHKVLFNIDSACKKIHKTVDSQTIALDIHNNWVNEIISLGFTSCTRRRVTSCDDFKLCDCWMLMMTRRHVMYPAFPAITPLGNNTTRVSNACIKTLLLWCRRRDVLSAVRKRFMIDNPARWTVDVRRYRIELLSCVCDIVSHINAQINKHSVN